MSIPLSFYFHNVLEKPKTYRFSLPKKGFFVLWMRKLEFLTFCGTRHLITKRPRELSCRLKSWLSYFGGFAVWTALIIRKSITLIFMSSSRDEFAFSQQYLVTDVSVGFRLPCWSPLEGDQHGDSIQSFINLSKTFLEYLAYGKCFHFPDCRLYQLNTFCFYFW